MTHSAGFHVSPAEASPAPAAETVDPIATFRCLCGGTEGKLKLDELVTRRYALEQINEAVDDLEHGRILGRAIITYR